MSREPQALRRAAPPSGEAGFSLPELLVAMAIGLIVIFGAFMLLDSSTRLSKATAQRVDATQRGRLALDLMMRELRSQVCLSGTTPPIVSGNATQVTFYVNLGGPDQLPERHQISLESGDLVLRRWVGTGVPPTMTWPATPTSTRTLLENVTTQGSTPLLRYFTWGAGSPLVPDSPLAAPLSGTSLALVVRIAVALRVQPARDFRDGSARGWADLQDAAFVRFADPNDTGSVTTGQKGPRCS